MNPAHNHLLINHLPIVGLFFGLIPLVYGLLRKNENAKNWGIILLMICSLSTFPANFTGEQAEEQVEKLEGVGHRIIHEHEEQAERMLPVAGMIVVSGILAFALRTKNPVVAQVMGRVVLLLTLLQLYFAYETGQSGGHIRHTEIRPADMPLTESDSNNVILPQD